MKNIIGIWAITLLVGMASTGWGRSSTRKESTDRAIPAPSPGWSMAPQGPRPLVWEIRQDRKDEGKDRQDPDGRDGGKGDDRGDRRDRDDRGNRREDGDDDRRNSIHVSITSPGDGTVTNRITLDVSVAFSTRDTIELVELLVGGKVATSFENPAHRKEGVHTFPGVDLSAFANTGTPGTLVARAFRTRNVSKEFKDSALVHVLVDTQAPTIGSLSPASGSSTSSPRPTLSAQVKDTGGSGIDPATVTMSLDGSSTAATVTVVNPNTVNVSFTPTADLSRGAHTFAVGAKDKAGNAAATSSSTFTVSSSLTPPVASIASPTNGSFTNNPTPLLAGSIMDTSGTGIDPATVVLRLDGAAVAATITPGTPTTLVQFTPAAALGAGVHTMTLDGRDRAGDAAPTATSTFTLDIAPPAITVTAPAPGSFFGTGAPTVTASLTDAGGSGVDPSSVVLRLNGAVQTSGVSVTGASPVLVSFTPPTPLAQGMYSASIDAKDRAGNAAPTATVSFTIDTTPPVITITAPGSGSFLGTTTPTVTANITDAGSGVDPSSVILRVNGAVQSSGVSVTGTNPVLLSFTPSTPLAQGANSVSIDAKDRAGNAAPTATVSFTIDTTPPVITITAPAPGSFLGTATPNITASLTAAGGSGVDPSSVVLRVNGAIQSSGVSVTGTNPVLVAFTPAAPLPQGTTSVSVDARDRAGIPGATATSSFIIDTTPPVITITAPAPGSFLGTTTPAVTASITTSGGSGVDPSSVVLRVNGASQSSGVSVTGTNPVLVSFTPAAPLAQGANSVSIDAKNRAGIAATTASVSFTIDTSLPVITITSPGSGSFLGTTTPTVTASISDVGSGVDPSSVILRVNGAIQSSGVSVTGTNPVLVSFTPAAPLAQGTNSVSVDAKNRAGVAATTATVSFTIDTTPPAITITAPGSGSFLGTTTPMVTASITTSGGSGVDPSSVVLRVNGAVQSSGVSVTGTNPVLVAFTPAATLPQGANSVSIDAKNRAGVAATTASVNFTIDTTPPVITITAPAPGSFLGTTTPTVTASITTSGGSGVDPSSVVLRVNGAIQSSGVSVTGTNPVLVSFTPAAPLAQGTNSVSVDAKNRAGVAATTVTVSFTIDTTPPVITITAPAPGSFLGTTTPIATASITDAGGSGVDPSSVVLRVNGAVQSSGVSVTGTNPVLVSFTPAAPLAQGANAVSIEAKDRAGNAATTATVSFTIDTIPPVITIVAPGSGSFLGTTTPTVTASISDVGSGVDPSSVVLRVNGAIQSSGIAVTGTNPVLVSFTPAAPLAQGANAVSIDAKDRAGNAATTATVSFTIDTIPPVITITAPSPGSFLGTTTPTVTASISDVGSGVDPSSVVLHVNGVVPSSGVSVTGTNPVLVSFTPAAPLAQGTNSISVDAKDRAGNVATTASVTFTIDTTPPVISITAPSPGSFLATGTPTVTASISDVGSGVDPSSVVVRVNGAIQSSGVAVTGTNPVLVSSTPAAPLPQGANSVSIDAKDRAGNAAPTASVSFTVDTTQPVISITSPSNGGFTNAPKPQLTAVVTDTGGSGLDLTTLTVRLDGVPVAATVTSPDVNTANVSFTPGSPLPQGVHSYTVDAKDRAGNAGIEGMTSFTVDLTPPVVGPLAPATGSSSDNPRPTIQATITDVGGSGIDATSVSLTLDGAPVTPSVNLTDPNTATVSFTPGTNFAVGAHSVSLSAKDRAGNGAVPGTSSFTITATSVTLSNPSISSGSFVDNAKPAFTATLVNSGGSGITPGSIVVRLDGVVVSATVTAVNGNTVTVSFTPSSPLAQGSHVITIDGQSGAGNPIATITDSFGVDLTPPVISILSPANSAILSSRQPTISAALSDSGGSGLDPSSLILQLNGIVVAATSSLSDPDHATMSFSPGTPLPDGAYGATFFASDRAGNPAVPVGTSFTVDGTPPVITITSPTSGNTYAPNAVPLSIQIADPQPGSGISLGTVRVSLNATDVTSTLTLSQSDSSHVSVTGTLQAASGTNSLSVTAQDNAGNTSSSVESFNGGPLLPPPTLVALPTVDVIAVSQAPGNLFTPIQGRAIMFQVRTRIGGVSQGDVVIDPQVTSGSGRIFYTPQFNQVSDFNGTAGFGFVPGAVGPATIVVGSRVGLPGTKAQFNMSVGALNPVFTFGGTGYPGSSFIASLSAGFLGPVTVFVDEVDAQHNPVTDPSLQKLNFFNRVYTTGSDGTLALPFQLKASASAPSATIRATFPEFRDQNGNPIAAFAVLGVVDQSQISPTTLVVSGNSQTLAAGRTLDQEIVIQANVPANNVTIIQANLTGLGTLQTTNPNILTQTPDGRTIVVQTTTGGTLTLTYKATGGQTTPVTIQTTAQSMASAPSPGVILPPDPDAQHVVVLAPQLEFIAGAAASELPSLPTTSLDEILQQTIDPSRYVRIRWNVPSSAIGSTTTSLLLQPLDAQGNPEPFDDAFPPYNQTIALTLDPSTNTYVSEPLMMTPDLQVLPATPSLPFKAVRLGMILNATSSSIPSMPQNAAPAINPSSDPSIPQAGEHPFDFLARSNGKINMIASSTTDVHLNLNVALPAGAPGPFTLTCTQVGGDGSAAGSFTGSDGNGNILTGPSITIPAATATSLSYRFNAPSSILQTTLTFTWNGTGFASGDASARVPVQIWADAGTIRITSQYLLTPGEVFANSVQHKGFRMERASDVTRRILAQGGITVVDTAVAAGSYPVFQVAPTGTVPSSALNYNGEQDAAAWFEGTSLQNQINLFASNLTLTYVDSIPLSQTPGLTVRTGPDARRYALATKATWSDVFGIATPCHETGHMLGLVDAALSQVSNLMMNQPDHRVMNALSNGVPSLAGGTQDQVTVIRQQAAIVNQP